MNGIRDIKAAFGALRLATVGRESVIANPAPKRGEGDAEQRRIARNARRRLRYAERRQAELAERIARAASEATARR